MIGTDIPEDMKMHRITLGAHTQLSTFRRVMMRIWCRALYAEVYGTAAGYPLKDVERDCRRGTQRCHECDDLICCDNLWLHDLVLQAECGDVDSNAAKLLCLLQEMGVNVGPHDRRVWIVPTTLVGKM